MDLDLNLDTTAGSYSVAVDTRDDDDDDAQELAPAAEEPSALEELAEKAKPYALPIGVALVALIAVAAMRAR